MNWQLLGVLADVVGAIAVVVSLLYLAWQVREASKQNASASHYQQTESTSTVFDGLHQDPELLRIYNQGNRDPSKLEKAEVARYVMLLGNIFARYNNYYVQKENGTINEETWKITINYVNTLANQPGLHMAWPLVKGNFYSGLQETVDEILSSNALIQSSNETSHDQMAAVS
ncbi:MAG: hypothetical protein V7742_21320 [Halioglobus sp.]